MLSDELWKLFVHDAPCYTACPFSIGDTVTFKSGGGPMTVVDFFTDDRVVLAWYSTIQKKAVEVNFSYDMLEKC